MRISSYDRTEDRFIVLVARRKAKRKPEDITISIPATIQKGERYNRDGKFVGEGFAEGEKVKVRWTTEDVEPKTGYRQNRKSGDTDLMEVKNGKLTFRLPAANRLTSIVFESPN